MPELVGLHGVGSAHERAAGSPGKFRPCQYGHGRHAVGCGHGVGDGDTQLGIGQLRQVAIAAHQCETTPGIAKGLTPGGACGAGRQLHGGIPVCSEEQVKGCAVHYLGVQHAGRPRTQDHANARVRLKQVARLLEGGAEIGGDCDAQGFVGVGVNTGQYQEQQEVAHERFRWRCTGWAQAQAPGAGVLARHHTSMWAAPALRSATAMAAAVAPVVNTSSTMATRRLS